MLSRLSKVMKPVAAAVALLTLWMVVNNSAQANSAAQANNSAQANNTSQANNSTQADTEAERIKLRPKIELNEPSVRMTLLNAVETSNKKYPSIARANQETHKLKGEVSVARTQYCRHGHALSE
jgi:Cu/Ag efflux protein CusF